MKRKIVILNLLLSLSLYVGSFFFPSDPIYIKLYAFLASLPLVYILLLYAIDKKLIKPTNDLAFEQDLNCFLGQSYYRWTGIFMYVLVLLGWGFHLRVYIEANGFWAPQTILYGLSLVILLGILMYHLFRKDTQVYFKKVQYPQKIWFKRSMEAIIIISLSYEPSFKEWITEIGLLTFCFMLLLSLRQMYVYCKRKNKKESPLNYYDQFQKPNR